MKSIIASIAVALTIASSTTAFAPVPRVAITTGATSTELFAEEKKEMVMDTNFDNVNIVRLLGLKKVKKMARKSKRKSEGK